MTLIDCAISKFLPVSNGAYYACQIYRGSHVSLLHILAFIVQCAIDIEFHPKTPSRSILSHVTFLGYSKKNVHSMYTVKSKHYMSEVTNVGCFVGRFSDSKHLCTRITCLPRSRSLGLIMVVIDRFYHTSLGNLYYIFCQKRVTVHT